jgi:streptolysin S family bacteriocin protoxin
MTSSGNRRQKPRVTIHRRLSDFADRQRTTALQAGGCCCCCCCCCLHWLGAAGGAIYGTVSAARTKNPSQNPYQIPDGVGFVAGSGIGSKKIPGRRVHPTVKTAVATGAWIGLGLAVIAIVAGISVLSGNTKPSDWILVPMAALAFVPSLVMVPVGIGALLGAMATRSIDVSVEETEYDRGAGLRMAWRIAWRSFAFSNLFAGVGYALMLAYWAIAAH